MYGLLEILAVYPYAAAALLLGDLGVFSQAWRGWRIVDEEIISPDGWRISRNAALAVPLLHAQRSPMSSKPISAMRFK